MWTLEQPGYLLLLILLPLGIWFRHFWRNRPGLIPIGFSHYRGKTFQPPPSAWRIFAVIAPVSYWLGASAVIASLCAPALISSERIFVGQGLNIMLVVDVSPSMAAQDQPGTSRLDRARETLRHFVHNRHSDSIGLLAFASEAAILCPPTLDYTTLESALDRLEANSLGAGTALGLGLSVAAVHLSQGGAANRVIVLISDGDNNAGELSPSSAGSLLRSSGVRLYSIGIGSDQEAYIQYDDPTSGRKYHGIYRGFLDEALLRGLAETTGGQYFFAGIGANLDDLLSNVDTAEKTESRTRLEVHRTPLSPVFILLGLGLIFFDLTIRRLVLRELA